LELLIYWKIQKIKNLKVLVKKKSSLSLLSSDEDFWEQTRKRDSSTVGQVYRMGFRWTKTDKYSEQEFTDETYI